MSYPFKNLVFEGGGVKGIAYVGALKVLTQKKILKNIKRVGGASAGAINAVLLALDYSLEETEDILWKLKFQNFMDDSWGVIRDGKRLIDEFGWYKGDFFRDWIGKLIKEKTGNAYSTFNDLHHLGMKDLYLVGTNLSTGFSEVFSYEHTPRMRVVDAARISMSIPLFFAAVRNMGDVYVDGGMLMNYPVKLFDRMKYIADEDQEKHARKASYYDATNKGKPKSSSPYVYNKETLGFRLDTAKEIAVFRDGAEPQHNKIEDFFDYAWAMIETIINAESNQHLHQDDWHRTVYINTLDVKTTDFGLNKTKKAALVKEGSKGAKDYLDWFRDVTDPDDMAMNHPDYQD